MLSVRADHVWCGSTAGAWLPYILYPVLVSTSHPPPATSQAGLASLSVNSGV